MGDRVPWPPIPEQIRMGNEGPGCLCKIFAIFAMYSTFPDCFLLKNILVCYTNHHFKLDYINKQTTGPRSPEGNVLVNQSLPSLFTIIIT